MNRVDKKIRNIMEVAQNAYVQARLAGTVMRSSASAVRELMNSEPVPGYRHDHDSRRGSSSCLYSIELPTCSVSLTRNESACPTDIESPYGITINDKKLDTDLLDTGSEQKVIGILGEFESVANGHLSRILNELSEAEKSKKAADEKDRNNKIKAQRGFLDGIC